jgi:hypothetical protein
MVLLIGITGFWVQARARLRLGSANSEMGLGRGPDAARQLGAVKPFTKPSIV